MTEEIKQLESMVDYYQGLEDMLDIQDENLKAKEQEIALLRNELLWHKQYVDKLEQRIIDLHKKMDEMREFLKPLARDNFEIETSGEFP